MTVQILMPALSPTMTEGTLSRWLVREGDNVASGDIIAEIETDKATMEIEAVDEGCIGRLLYDEGSENVAVNTPIAVLLEEGEDPSIIDGILAEAEKTPSPDKTTEGDLSSPAFEPVQKEPPQDTIPATAEPRKEVEVEVEWEGAMVEKTFRVALRDAMVQEMRRDGDVFIMGEEVGAFQGAFKVSQGLLEEFGEKRVCDTPISEHGFCGIGIGAAFAGLRPIVEFMTMNFALQAMDQIINSAAKTHYMSNGAITCPIVFRGPNGGSARAAAQHSQCLASTLITYPGLKIVAPSCAADAQALLKAAIRDPNPVVVLEHELLYGKKDMVPDSEDWILPIGKARIMQQGTDVTLVGFSRMVGTILRANEILKNENINAEIIDLRSLRPLDMETILASIRKTNRLVVVEECWPVAGIGAEISASISEQAFDWLDAPVLRVAGADTPMPYAANLEALAMPDADAIVKAAKRVCYKDS